MEIVLRFIKSFQIKCFYFINRQFFRKKEHKYYKSEQSIKRWEHSKKPIHTQSSVTFWHNWQKYKSIACLFSCVSFTNVSNVLKFIKKCEFPTKRQTYYIPWTIGRSPSLVESLVTRLNKSRLGNCPFKPSTLTFKWVNFSWDISRLIAACREPARASRSPWSSTYG